MSIITRMRKQTAVYWGTPAVNGYGGWTFATPVELSCRWDDVAEEFVDSESGKTILSRAIAYVGTDLDLNGFLFLGTEDDLPSDDSDPTVISGAYRIKRFSKIPNLRATEFLRYAHLV